MWHTTANRKKTNIRVYLSLSSLLLGTAGLLSVACEGLASLAVLGSVDGIRDLLLLFISGRVLGEALVVLRDEILDSLFEILVVEIAGLDEVSNVLLHILHCLLVSGNEILNLSLVLRDESIHLLLVLLEVVLVDECLESH